MAWQDSPLQLKHIRVKVCDTGHDYSHFPGLFLPECCTTLLMCLDVYAFIYGYLVFFVCCFLLFFWSTWVNEQWLLAVLSFGLSSLFSSLALCLGQAMLSALLHHPPCSSSVSKMLRWALNHVATRLTGWKAAAASLIGASTLWEKWEKTWKNPVPGDT